MILQVAIGVFIGSSSSSSFGRFIVVVIVWGSSSVVVLEASPKSVDNAGADSVFARARGSKSVRSERNGSRPLSGSFSK